MSIQQGNSMNDMQRQRSFSVGAIALVVIATAWMTWLCIGWFGALSPLTAAVGVMLVELFLACVAVMVMLLAARLSDAYLVGETRCPEQPPRSRELWLWRPIWLPRSALDQPVQQPAPIALTPIGDWLRSVHNEMRPLDDMDNIDDMNNIDDIHDVDEPPATLRFPTGDSADRSTRDIPISDPLPHRRAA